MEEFDDSPRDARARPEPAVSHAIESAARIDLERIRFSPAFSRLAEVTRWSARAQPGPRHVPAWSGGDVDPAGDRLRPVALGPPGRRPAPRRLIDLVACARRGYARVAAESPDLLGHRLAEDDLARMARGRGIIDFVIALTDARAVAFADRLGGGRELLWSGSAL